MNNISTKGSHAIVIWGNQTIVSARPASELDIESDT
jgi:hypothetical protein